jgi:predicted PurR-regulated permease PerM
MNNTNGDDGSRERLLGRITALLWVVVIALAVTFFLRQFVLGPVAATVGMLFWSWLWGATGLLQAVPLTAFVKLVADCHPVLLPISNLLAERPRAIPQWA